MADETASNGTPWWVKSLTQLGMTFGMPTIIVGYFLLQDAGIIRNPVAENLDKVHSSVQHNGATLRDLVHAMEKHADQFGDAKLAKQMRCILEMQSEGDKATCFDRAIKDR